MNTISNITFDKISIGQQESVSRTLSRTDIEALAFVSGDLDAYHVEGNGGRDAGTVTEAVASEAFVSYILNRRFPGPGTRIEAVDLKFRGSLNIGDTITATLVVRDKKADGARILFDCRCTKQTGEEVAKGTATAAAPTQSITYSDLATPEIIFRRTDVFARLIRSCEGLPPVKCAIVHPCDRDSLLGPLEAARRKLIEAVLVGPEAKIRAVAAANKADLGGCRIISTEHSEEAATKAVAMARAGEVQSLMKGSLHTDELMGAVVPSATGLRTGRRISHAFVLDVPTYPRMLIVTDAAINISPTLKDKVHIVQNAIELAQMLGVERPKVAILSAVETINPDIPSTLDAAALCKMADRKQIVGGVLDGPLAFDNAISASAAKIKKIESAVAGEADILLAPDLEAGNMIAKQLQYLAGADSAGIVLGTRVPIVLTSRADTVRTRLASTAVMALVAHARSKPGAPAMMH
jgi:phosphate acetyltransferase